MITCLKHGRFQGDECPMCVGSAPTPPTPTETFKVHVEVWRAEEIAQLTRRDLYDCDAPEYYLHSVLFAQASRIAERYEKAAEE